MADKKLHIDDLLRDALGDYTEQPPVGAWDDLKSKLDNRHPIDSLFAETLSDYTEVPPVGAWAGMEAKLDDKQPIDILFSDALSNYTETPPAGAWTDMEARLDGKRRRRPVFIWFWLAAGLAGLLLGSYLLLNGDKEENSITQQTEQSTPVQTPVDAPVPAENNKPATDNNIVAAAPVKMPQPAREEPKAPIEQAPKQQVQQIAPQPEPKQETPVANKPQPEQAPVQEPAAKTENTIQPEPVKDNNVIADKAEEPAKAEPVVVDDIAAAIKKRSAGLVMNIKRSQYADSIAEMEAKQQTPVVASAPKDSITPAPQQAAIVAKQEEVKAIEPAAQKPVDTMSAIVTQTLQETEKVLQPAQDAILPANQQIQTPPDAIVFKDVVDENKAATFIGPMPDTADYTYNNTGAYTASLPASSESNETANGDAPEQRGFQADIFFKAGYERGIDKTTLSKFVAAPAVTVKLGKKLGLVFQPAVKVGGVNRKDLNDRQSYHSVQSSYVDSVMEFKQVTSAQGVPSNFIRTKYLYQQTHDSVVVSHSYDRRAIVEVDLPLMLSYKVANNVSVYGGPVFSFGNMAQVNTQTNTYTGATRIDSVYSAYRLLGTSSTGPASVDDVLKYNTKNYNTYKEAAYANAPSKLRMGYTAGVSYTAKNLSIDFSLQQNLSRLNYIPNAGVRNIYLQPYVRFMLGYKLYSNKK